VELRLTMVIGLESRVSRYSIASHVSKGIMERTTWPDTDGEGSSFAQAPREWHLIMDALPGLMALLTATGEVEVVNRKLLEYFGQTLEELRNWGTNGTVHPEDLPHVTEVFTRSIASADPM
jgi:PAS domain-containing protein